jgi:hypothetical protein
MRCLPATELTVLLKRRPERDEAGQHVRYRGYDVYWPDGRTVSVGVRRFCQHGTRLLLGRSADPEEALVQIKLYPVEGLEAALTRPGAGMRCRRFFALRQSYSVRLHYFTGTPTEVCFDLRHDDPEVLHWLHAESLPAAQPFWFDLGSRVLTSGVLA